MLLEVIGTWKLGLIDSVYSFKWVLSFVRSEILCLLYLYSFILGIDSYFVWHLIKLSVLKLLLNIQLSQISKSYYKKFKDSIELKKIIFLTYSTFSENLKIQTYKKIKFKNLIKYLLKV